MTKPDDNIHPRPKYDFILKCPAELYGKDATHQCVYQHNHKHPHACTCGRKWAPSTGRLVPADRQGP